MKCQMLDQGVRQALNELVLAFLAMFDQETRRARMSPIVQSHGFGVVVPDGLSLLLSEGLPFCLG